MTTTKMTASDRKARDEKFRQVWAKALAEGRKAGEDIRPMPMVVVQRANPWDDNSPIVKQYAPVMDGVCGFAWVTVYPGNSPFARWMKANGIGRLAYKGGWQFWIGEFNQSLERKEAMAQKMAAVLRDELGEKVYPGSRMD
jgi:hypothetical protein